MRPGRFRWASAQEAPPNATSINPSNTAARGELPVDSVGIAVGFARWVAPSTLACLVVVLPCPTVVVVCPPLAFAVVVVDVLAVVVPVVGA